MNGEKGKEDINSKKFVKKWIKRYKQTKNVDNFPERGRTRVTNSKQDKEIVTLFEKNSTLRLRETKFKLAKKGIYVSLNTIRRHLHEAKLSYRSTSSKPLRQII
ncbi:unnamed protein product [Euphydryas editha]|uniref:Transposase n=1 Tax=Euphydryas editha TaxID=104508 RepID=A0AAU9UE86_EUPED|nr:unnamed protein product [Euphydryas editha]